MSIVEYVYENEKAFLFTDHGQRIFVQFRDAVLKLLQTSGAVRVAEMLRLYPTAGSTYEILACISRMEEIGDLREVTVNAPVGQHRVYVSAKSDA